MHRARVKIRTGGSFPSAWKKNRLPMTEKN